MEEETPVDETEAEIDTTSFVAVEKIDLDEEEQAYINGLTEDDRWKINIFQSVDFSLTNGFQLTTAAGSLCEEPLEGVAIYIDSLEIKRVPDAGL